MSSFPYDGEDFCLLHGREHMRYRMGDPIPYCEACEQEKESDETAGTAHAGMA